MNQTDAYFTNKVSLMGKITAWKDETDDFQSFLLETKEVWPEGETKLETHEIRYYKNDRHPTLDVAAVTGQLVEVTGRIRPKEDSGSEYRPFIHCLHLQMHNS